MKKKILSMLLAGCMVAGLAACGAPASNQEVSEATAEAAEAISAEVETESDIAKAVVSQFTEIAAIPRPHSHEEKIGAYLMEWAEQRGIPAEMDDCGNVFMEVAATEGMEEAPLVGLQVHMDMVFTTADGVDLDPLTTPITVVNDGNVLTSDGRTSLGADDGIGVATALCVADGYMEHGPLRIIITTNEEMGMTGSMGMDPQRVADILYLINLDNEESSTVCVSSAGGTVLYMDQTFEEQDNTELSGINLTISGLNGGHSGMEIGKNGANAIKVLAEAISILNMETDTVVISSLQGGSAENAIPQQAQAVLAVKPDQVDEVVTALQSELETMQESILATDPDMTFKVEQAEAPKKVLSAEDSSAILQFLQESFNGVYTMSADIADLVESSSNVGLLSLENGVYHGSAYVRSSDAALMDELVAQQEAVAEQYHLECEKNVLGSAWKYDPDNQLLALLKTQYKELFGEEVQELAVHAGLECGTFAEYNPDMEIVSIGPDISGPHTTKETVQIPSIEKQWRLLEAVLKNIM